MIGDRRCSRKMGGRRKLFIGGVLGIGRNFVDERFITGILSCRVGVSDGSIIWRIGCLNSGSQILYS